MCTAIALDQGGTFFGRNLDLEEDLHPSPILCPRDCPLPLRHLPALTRHHAMLGMALEQDGFPLFFDAVSEHGLAMAGLNFPGECVYHRRKKDALNIAPFELIPYVLGVCQTLEQAQNLLTQANLTDDAFSPTLGSTPLHFMLASAEGSLVIESTAQGLCVYDNPAQVMTNSPAFPWHMQRLSDFMGLSRHPAENRLSPALPLRAYSRGMGAMGLPGDLSSSSRFVRAAFARANSAPPPLEDASEAGICQLFHLLDFVAFPHGCVQMRDGRFEYTVYSSCMDLERGSYHYRTYTQPRMQTVSLRGQEDGGVLRIFPL